MYYFQYLNFVQKNLQQDNKIASYCQPETNSPSWIQELFSMGWCCWNGALHIHYFYGFLFSVGKIKLPLNYIRSIPRIIFLSKRCFKTIPSETKNNTIYNKRPPSWTCRWKNNCCIVLWQQSRISTRKFYSFLETITHIIHICISICIAQIGIDLKLI